MLTSSPPHLGLYTCSQDFPRSAGVPVSEVSESVDLLPTVSDDVTYFEAQAQVAASMGMSPSIIKQMNAGAYTYDQVEILLAQRRHVIDTIRRIKHPSTSSVPPTPPPASSASEQSGDIIASAGLAASPPQQAGTGTNAANQTTAAPPSTPQKKVPTPQKAKPPCVYQVCHTCRPMFQDRLFHNIAPILSSDVPVKEQMAFRKLPVHNAAVVSNLGLRTPPPPLRRSEESMDITMHQRDGAYDSFGQESSSDWTPTTSSSEGDSDVDMSPCPGRGSCPVWSPIYGCAYDNGFDDGQREIAHGYSGGHLHGLGIVGDNNATATPDLTPSKGSSISLPNPPTTPMTDGGRSDICSYSLPDPDRSSPKSNKSDGSSEVEVEGGVALTEEAIRTGTPEIATK